MDNNPRRNNDGTIIFSDFPNFTPNLSPVEIFELGSFGGTYWRPIYSKILNKKLKNQHINDKWDKNNNSFRHIPEKFLSSSVYDNEINKYKVKVGQSLEEWEKDRKGGPWIRQYDPYGWVQWYWRFYNGRRLNNGEDERQINRWLGIAGKNGRFKKWLVTLILKKDSEWNNDNISPKIRQTLQHWGYKLTLKDFKDELKSRK